MARHSSDAGSVKLQALEDNTPLICRLPVQIGFAIFAAAFIALAIVGGIRTFSPVPFADMVDGALNFFMRVSDGDSSAWWAQHNEHRILLARSLFWLDYNFFGGTTQFLIVVNYLLALTGLLVFRKFLRDMADTPRPDAAEWIVTFVMTAWLFQWMQDDNFRWAFQSQFFLAQLLPLGGLYLLARAVPTRGFSTPFLGACALGIGSACAMANGIIALPLLTVYALLTRQGRARIAVLAALAALMLYLYFHDYVAPAHHGSLRQALAENPLGLIHYVLLYVGSPFNFLFGEGNLGRLAATFAGLFLVIGSLLVAWRVVPRRDKLPIQLALLTFILYVGGTALGTAGGRLIFGVEQALTSRYTTPGLMAWVALTLIATKPLLHAIRMHGVLSLLVFCILGVFMVQQQRKALLPAEDRIRQLEVAGLALALGVLDKTQIRILFPAPDIAVDIAKKAEARQLGIFGVAPLRGLRAEINTNIGSATTSLTACRGSLSVVESFDGDDRFKRVHGWLFDPQLGRSPEHIQFIDMTGHVVGIALPGKRQPDIATSLGKQARHSGFSGYILARSAGEPIRMRSANGGCELNATAPRTPFTVNAGPIIASAVTLTRADILAGNQWLGADPFRTNLPALQVYGSYLYGDGDTGAITLMVRRGARILYRSGPTAGRQVIEIPDSNFPEVVLPTAVEWTVLDFNDDRLPSAEFAVRFSDEGTSWGEWSAIAVRNETH